MLKLGIVVGHEHDKAGAKLNLPPEILKKYNFDENYAEEYDYNLEVVNTIEATCTLLRIDAKKFLRDGIGIVGAHHEAEAWGANVVLELHFNSHSDTTIKGAEVLTTIEYAKLNGFAEEMALVMANVFSGKNRGVKFPTEPHNDGHPNVTRPVPTYLLEPFFGSNPEQAEAGLRNMVPYAKAILQTVNKYFGK